LENFTPIPSLLGGVLIGISASLLLIFDGKVAGISGILGGLLKPVPGDTAWRGSFVGGLLVGGVLLQLFLSDSFGESQVSLGMVAAAGLLVGYGTRLGNGCTSGHGVCGNSRISPRSLAATITFILTGAITVYVSRHLLGGGA
jgi:uncharacterized membrane protein YedE/YeeE